MIGKTFFFVFWFAVVLSWCAPAVAQQSLRATISAERVEVGQEFEIELSAMSQGGAEPTDPRLSAPGTFRISGPSVGSQQRISFVNGHFERQSGITASWTLVGTQAGRFVIGPPSVNLGSTRVKSNAVNVEVVAAGTLPSPSRRRRSPFFDDPFFDDLDPFKLFPRPQIPDDDPNALLGTPSNVPDEYRVERAADPVAFLRAAVTPNRAFVGEQVTLRVYSYGARGPYEEVNTSEPSRADFLSHVIVENSYRQPQYRVVVDNQTFFAVKVREAALFPLRAGTLRIGPMRMGFRGRGYPSAAVHEGLVRYSTPLDVVVAEPPSAGRPPGYRMGDVGTFRLSATVEPRQIRAGEALRVVATLEGTGNLPNELRIPERKGIEWSDPRTTDEITVNASLVGGVRKFAYVVRIDEPGQVELGELSLSYFDPRQSRYDVARAALGTVNVAAAPARASAPEEAEKITKRADQLAGLLTVRRELGAAPRSPRRFLDHPWFWALLAAGPLGVIGISGAYEIGRRLRRSWAARRQSQPAQSKEALKDARRAAESGDAAKTATHVEKAVHAAIEGFNGLRARGILRAELASELMGRGVSESVARATSEVLDDCDSARFTGELDGSPVELCARAEQVVSGLRAKKNSAGGRA